MRYEMFLISHILIGVVDPHYNINSHMRLDAFISCFSCAYSIDDARFNHVCNDTVVSILVSAEMLSFILFIDGISVNSSQLLTDHTNDRT